MVVNAGRSAAEGIRYVDRFAVRSPELVVHHLLEKRLRDALRESPMHLALHKHRVQHPTAVVHRDVPDQTHVARLDVDLHHCYVSAERERVLLLVATRLGEQPRLEPFRRIRGRNGQVLPRQGRLGRPGDAEASLGQERHVFRRGLQQVRSELRALSTTVSAASKTEDPAICSEREP
jgi:hypothetical protein